MDLDLALDICDITHFSLGHYLYCHVHLLRYLHIYLALELKIITSLDFLVRPFRISSRAFMTEPSQIN